MTAHKLTYRLTGQRDTQTAGASLVDIVAVEWRHADGPIQHTKLVPVSHPPDVRYETVPDGEPVAIIHDSISVPHGAPDSIVMQMCEEKRAALAANLGVSP